MNRDNFMGNHIVNVKYSNLHEGKTIVHFVGGKMTDDLKQNLGEIAQWVLDNDITILWGDDYQEKENANHPVAALINAVKVRAKEMGVKPNTPIRILQLGNQYETIQRAGKDFKLFLDTDFELGADFALTKFSYNDGVKTLKETTKLIPVYDNSNKLIGYYDDAVQDEMTIYTEQQQDRQRAYYNNADALFVLPGGPGCAYEITNAFIYKNTGDLPQHFKIYVIDNDDASYYDYIKSYLKLTGNNKACEEILLGNYNATASDFVENNVYVNKKGL